jgi:hypothetical protein
MLKKQGHCSDKIRQTTIIIGGCHCRAVKFTAEVAINTIILDCNCSICAMTGFKHLVVPHSQFKLLSGKSQLSSYQFNTNQANHLFCSVCGVKSFYQPRSHPDSWSINTHCIDDFVESEWQHESFDGKNWEQAKEQLS